MLDLQSQLEEGLVDIVLIQQPYCYKGAVRGISSAFQIFESVPIVNRGSRAAIVVCRKRVHPEIVPELVGDEGVCVKIRLYWGTVYFVTLYCIFGGRIQDQIVYLNKVLRKVRGGILLIGMDAKAHPTEWHCKKVTDDERKARGDRLACWAQENHLIVLNQPSVRYTYIGRGNASSDIDMKLRSG